MKLMLRLLILSLILTPLVTLAQPATQPGGRPGRGGPGAGGDRPRALIDRIEQALSDSDLSLSDRQRDKIKGILEDTRKQMRDLFQELQNLEPQDRQQKLREFMKGVHDQIVAELDDSQKEGFEKKLQEIRGSLGQGQGAGQPGGQGGGMAMFERMQAALKGLDLSDDQKKQVDGIIEDTRKQVQEIREKVRNGGDPQEAREQGRQILMDVREKLQGILNPEQQAKLRDAMRPAGNGPASTQPTTDDRAKANTEAPKDTSPPAPDDKPKADTPRTDATPPPDKPSAVQVGSAAPEFNLQKLDGKPLQLSSFKGHTLVLIFGSASSPSFRDRAKAIQELYRDLGAKATFLIVYTKEAHAQGEWEVDRNKDEKISIPQHASMEDRIKLAKQTREGLKFTVPFAVDSMDNATLNAFGAEENSAFVIGKDGMVAVNQKWCDPYRLRTAVEKVLATPPATQR